MFQDPEYVRWANEATIHVIAYSLDPNAEKPEPMVEVDRDGTKTKVFEAYPAFTPEEMQELRGEIEPKVKYPIKTPWAGVLSPDGKQAFSEVTKGASKDFRAAYEAGQKKLGAPLDRATWKKIRAAIEASTNAEFDGDWRKAVTSAIEARDAAKSVPPPLGERIEARISSLVDAGKARLAAARKEKMAADAAKAEAKVLADFAGLSLEPAAK